MPVAHFLAAKAAETAPSRRLGAVTGGRLSFTTGPLLSTGRLAYVTVAARHRRINRFDTQPSVGERCAVLRVVEQPQGVMIHEVLDTVQRGDQVVHLQMGAFTVSTGSSHSHHLEIIGFRALHMSGART